MLLFLLQNCCIILTLSIKSEILNKFQSLSCLNNWLDLHNKIGSFAGGTTTPLIVQSGTKKYFTTKDKGITSG